MSEFTSLWCALTWNVNSHLYIPGYMCLFCQLRSCGVVISNDKEAHLTTCCLELPLCMPISANMSHIHLNTKKHCMCGCWGFTSSRYGHIKVPNGVGALTLMTYHTSVSSDGVNTWHVYIYWFWTSHCMLTMYFPHNLGPSVVKVMYRAIYCLFNYHIHLCCPWMLYVSPVEWLQIFMAHVNMCLYILCTYALYVCHWLPGLHPSKQQCPLADH